MSPGTTMILRIPMPRGIDAALEGLTREVLKQQPENIYAFAAEHFARLLNIRKEQAHNAGLSPSSTIGSTGEKQPPPDDVVIVDTNEVKLADSNGAPKTGVGIADGIFTQEGKQENEERKETSSVPSEPLSSPREDNKDSLLTPDITSPRETTTSTPTQSEPAESDKKDAIPSPTPPSSSREVTSPPLSDSKESETLPPYTKEENVVLNVETKEAETAEQISGAESNENKLGVSAETSAAATSLETQEALDPALSPRPESARSTDSNDTTKPPSAGLKTASATSSIEDDLVVSQQPSRSVDEQNKLGENADVAPMPKEETKDETAGKIDSSSTLPVLTKDEASPVPSLNSNLDSAVTKDVASLDNDKPPDVVAPVPEAENAGPSTEQPDQSLPVSGVVEDVNAPESVTSLQSLGDLELDTETGEIKFSDLSQNSSKDENIQQEENKVSDESLQTLGDAESASQVSDASLSEEKPTTQGVINVEVHAPDVDKTEKSEEEILNAAATTIQATFKGFKTRQDLKKEDLKQQEEDLAIPPPSDLAESAATTIQAGFRGFKTRQELKKSTEDAVANAPELLNSAATTIQASFRGYQTRQQLKKERSVSPQPQQETSEVLDVDDTLNAAASKIQAGFKGYKVRKELKKEDEEKPVEPARSPLQIPTIDIAIDESVLNSAATTIQAGFRGFQTRQQLKKQQTKSASNENVREGSEENNDERALEEAATKIQSTFRGFQTRQQLRKDEDEVAIVVGSLKSEVEGQITGAQETVKDNLEAASDAVAGFVEEKADKIGTKSDAVQNSVEEIADQIKATSDTVVNFVEEKADNMEATSDVVVNAVDEKVDKMVTELETGVENVIDVTDTKLNEAASKIQANFKGYKVRKDLNAEKEANTDGGEENTKEEEPKQDIVEIPLYGEDAEAAVVKIQAGIRGYQTRKALAKAATVAAPEAADAVLDAAASKIQAGFRGFQTRQALRKDDGDGDAGKQISADRLRELQRPPECDELPEHRGLDPDNAATKIQAGVRGFLTRRQLQKAPGGAETPSTDSAAKSATRSDDDQAKSDPVQTSGSTETQVQREAPVDDDQQVWETLQQEMSAAAARVQSDFRGSSVRTRLQREDAVRLPTSSSSSDAPPTPTPSQDEPFSPSPAPARDDSMEAQPPSQSRASTIEMDVGSPLPKDDVTSLHKSPFGEPVDNQEVQEPSMASGEFHDALLPLPEETSPNQSQDQQASETTATLPAAPSQQHSGELHDSLVLSPPPEAPAPVPSEPVQDLPAQASGELHDSLVLTPPRSPSQTGVDPDELPPPPPPPPQQPGHIENQYSSEMHDSIVPKAVGSPERRDSLDLPPPPPPPMEDELPPPPSPLTSPSRAAARADSVVSPPPPPPVHSGEFHDALLPQSPPSAPAPPPSLQSGEFHDSALLPQSPPPPPSS